MTVLDDFDQARAEFARLVDAVQLTDLDRPTPCTEWNLRQLLNHVVTGTWWFTTVILGEEAPDRTIDQILDDPSGAFARRADDFRAAIAAPGALEASYAHPMRAVDGTTYTMMRINEFLCHGFDVAMSIGEQPHFDQDVARRCRELYEGLLEGRNREPGKGLGAPLEPPAGADEYGRLIAFFGRSPSDW